VTDLFSLLIHTLASVFRKRSTLILENLLLRQQLQVALRPKRRLRLRGRDRLLWIVVRRLQPDWRRYLLFVRPETVIRRIGRAGVPTGGGDREPASAGRGCQPRSAP
jgi:hypothetical protein